MSLFNIYTVSSQVYVFPHVYLPHSLSGEECYRRETTYQYSEKTH